MADECIAEYTDPQFMNTLEACLKTEIIQLNSNLAEQNTIIKKIQGDLAWKWKEAKNMDERIKDCQANIEFVTIILKSLEKYNTNLQSQLDMMKANLDDAFRLMSQEIKQHKQILQQYQEAWEQYKAQYEDAPLAKARSEARVNLEKLHIKEMVLDFKHKELTKRIHQSKCISWLRLRSKIVEFAEAMLENCELNQRLSIQRANFKKSKEVLYAVNAELEFEKKKFDDENKMRSQQILEMPPPKMYLPLYRKNDTKQMDLSKIGEQWKNQCKKSSDTDTISITGSIYAEILHQEEECSSTQSLEAEGTQFEKSNSYSQGSNSYFQRSIAREISMKNLDLTEEQEEEKLIEVDADNEEPVQMEHEPEERRNISAYDLDNQLTEEMSTVREKQKPEAERARQIAEKMGLEPAMKRMRMTINRDLEGRNARDTSCSTVNVCKWDGPRDRKTLVPESSGTSEQMHQPEPQVPRVVNVEKVHVELFSKFGRQQIAPNIVPNITPNFAPLPYSSRNYYCESDAASGIDALVNLTDVGSFCADSIAEFSGCTNLSPSFSMMGDRDMQGPVESSSGAQANNKKTNFQAFGFGCPPTDKPGPTKFF